MKAKDKKAIEALKAEIKALNDREVELENGWDALWDAGKKEEWKIAVEAGREEYEAIDGKIENLRREIRAIRDKDMIDWGYFHEMNLVRANID